MGDVQLPILKDTRDPHYRYKMPKLMAKVEGSGNGIKTVITNMDAIARSLGRPPAYPTKYFGCELGAQVTMNNEIYIVNGSHDPEKLLNLLYGFIRKFVLCPKCNNPETKLSVVGQNIHQKCIACGHSNTLNKAIHKLTTYIINHPAEGVSNTNATKGKSSKADKKSKKNGNSSPTNGNGDSGNDNGKQNNNNEDDFDDEFDVEDTTSEAYQERMKNLCEGLNNDMYLSDTKENANIFYALVKERKETNKLEDVVVQKELVAEAERLKIKDKATLILSELLFTENILEEIKTHRLLFLRFCHENKKAQKYLLGGFEKIVGDVFKDKLFNSACKILKELYDEDIIEEEVIIEWSKKESKKYVSKDVSKKLHEKAAPFIKWLKEAEVEEESSDDEKKIDTKSPSSSSSKASNGSANNGKSGKENNNADQRRHSVSDDEDDDDGIDLEFSHRVSGIQVESVKPIPIKAVNADLAVSASGADEDLDIDNI